MATQKPVLFNNTVLRDGHQSLAATRMTTAQMVPVAGDLDRIGFNALETWGGATIDSCLRYLAENPFDRLRHLKKLAPHTPHMMLLRGQNIVQYTAFPDDVVEAFVRSSAHNGMDIFRIFDALNDLQNVRTAVKTVLAEGKHPQGAISYTTSPVHTIDAFVRMGVEFEKMGCQSICIKDMAGLLTPRTAYDLVKSLKEKVGIPLVLHSHNTAGLAVASYYAAVEAGIDILDVSVAPFANGTGQPDAILMQEALAGTGRAPTYDKDAVYRLRDHFRTIYAAMSQYTSPANERTDADILRYQVPGGMMSNFLNQLKEQGMGGQVEEVMNEMPYVRKCLGWIPLVTPTSQIVGTQAMLNIKFGRWKNIAQPTMDVVLGKYGRTPGPVDQDLLDMVVKKSGQKPVEGRPADQLPPRMDALKKELESKGMPGTDEIAVLYAMFPTQTEAVVKGTAVPEYTGEAVAPKPVSVTVPAAATSSVPQSVASQVASDPTIKPVSTGRSATEFSTSALKQAENHMELELVINGHQHHVRIEEFED